MDRAREPRGAAQRHARPQSSPETAVIEGGLQGGETVVVEGAAARAPRPAGEPRPGRPRRRHARRRSRPDGAERACSPRSSSTGRASRSSLALVMTLAGAAGDAAHPGRAVPGHRAAAGPGHHALSRRLRRGGRTDRGAGDRERSVNGVDRMIYMRSNSANDGTYTPQCLLRARHQPRHRHRQRQQPRAGRARATAAGGAARRA